MRKALTAVGLGAGLLLAPGALAGGWVDVPADLGTPALQGPGPAGSPAAAPAGAAPSPKIDVLPAAATGPAPRPGEPVRGASREAPGENPSDATAARALPGAPAARDEARPDEPRAAARDEPRVRERRARTARVRRPSRDWDTAGYYRGRGVMRTRWGYARLVDNPNNDTRRPGVIEFIPGSGPRRR